MEIVIPGKRPKLPPPLDVYEHVFWRLLYIFFWMLAVSGPILALLGFASLFVDVPGEVRSTDEKVGFIVGGAVFGAVGWAYLHLWHKASS